MRRALPFAAMAAAFSSAVHCGSFSSSPPAPAADAGADAPQPDLDASPGDGGVSPGCAGRLAPSGFCADFEDGLLVAWRGPNKETLWKLSGDAGELPLVPSERPSGGTSLVAAPGGSGQRGYLTYDAPAMNSVSLAFAIRIDTLPASASGMTVVALELAKATVTLRVAGSGERIVLDGDGAPQRVDLFASGYPPLLGNWRTVTIALRGTGDTRHIGVRVDGVAALDIVGAPQLPDFTQPLPVSLSVGAVESNEAGYRVRIDDVRLTVLE